MIAVNMVLALAVLTLCARFVLALFSQQWYTDRIAECDKAHYTCEQFHAMAAMASPWYVKLESKLRKRGV